MEVLEIAAGAGIRVLQLREHRITIGRSEENDLVIGHDSTVSRHHAVLEKIDARWRVRDLRSRNGTYVNGGRVSSPTTVNPGDRLKFGDTSVTFIGSSSNQDPVLDTMQSDELGQAPGPRLTNREREIIRLVCDGRTDAQIAASLMISLKTVHSHLDRIRDKTGARRRADLTRLGVQLGLAK